VSLDNLSDELRRAGVDGVLVTDLVPEEAGEHIKEMREANINTVFLIAPTSTDERLKLIADACTGFVYAVSRAGVKGVRQRLAESAARVVERSRRFTDLPVAVGFGVSTADHIAEVWQHADAAVVGSRIVAEIEAYANDPALVERIGALTKALVSRRSE